MNKHQKKKGGGGGLLLSVALGAALAAGAGYYATHKEEVDKEAKKRIDQLAKIYKENRPQVEKKVRDIWGKVTDEAVANYMELRAAVLKSLEEENLEQTGKVLREKYEDIVDSVIASAKKSGVLNRVTEEKISKMFKQDWQKIGKALMENASKLAKTAKSKVNAARRGAAKGKKAVVNKKKPSAKKTAAKKPVKKVTKKATPRKKS